MMHDTLVSDVSRQIRLLLDGAVQRNLAECILLSGGLDTSIVTVLATKYSKLSGITVSLGEAPDVRFAKIIAEKYGIRHQVVRVDHNDIERAIMEVVRVMQSFDPMEIRNDATILIGLKSAKDAGFNGVLTGDAGDELFAGYSFFFKMSSDELEKTLRKMWTTMRFSSVPLAESLGMQVKLPFLDEEFKNYAMEIPVQLKVREERGQLYGKWILRKSFEQDLPDEILWRVKMPIEQGSGTSILSGYYAAKIQDSEFKKKKNQFWQSDHVKIRDKEQLAYYEIYREFFGTPGRLGSGSKVCTGCSTHLPREMSHCGTCGEYPV
jgi:asparagine synthase (glutamine-hydrolysing)